MGTVASQITSLTIVYTTVISDADQSKHQSSASLAFVWGIHRRPVNSPHKWPVTRKMFPFDDVIMIRDLLCFVVVWFVLNLTISFRVTSLVLGQTYDCPSGSEAALKNMGKWITWIRNEPWWRHQMETFSALVALYAGTHRSPVKSRCRWKKLLSQKWLSNETVNCPHKRQWSGALMLSLICAWTNGDFRRHRAHCDATLQMIF